MYGPKKLECYITLGWKGLPRTKFIAYWAHSQHFIFFVTYVCAQEARVLHYTRLERPANDKRSSLLGLFISNEDKEVL
jgi:hypothetical protein